MIGWDGEIKKLGHQNLDLEEKEKNWRSILFLKFSLEPATTERNRKEKNLYRSCFSFMLFKEPIFGA